MSKPQRPTAAAPEGGDYEIRLEGHLDEHWAAWFDGLTVINEPDGTSSILGLVVDQSALHGVLQKIRDLGLPLISVAACGPRSVTQPEGV